MVSTIVSLRTTAVIALLIITGVLLCACGGGEAAKVSAPAVGTPVVDTAESGAFPLPGPAALMDLITPGHEVSTVQNAADYRVDLPSARVNVPDASSDLDFTPDFSAGADPPSQGLAYCLYTFNIADYTGPASLTLDWTFEPVVHYDVWLGFANQDSLRWTWFNCPAGYLLPIGEIAPYTTPAGDVLVAVAMTGTGFARLHTLILNAGYNEAPVAELVIPANGGSINGTTTLDASGSTDADGTITTYEWDFTADGTYDQTTAVATVDHTFATAGYTTVRVRVTDDRGETDTAEVNIKVYHESEDNDDGAYGTATPADLASANPLPAIDFTGFTGNCGNNSYDGDKEDYFSVNVTTPGWVTFIMYHIDDEADLELALIKDNGDGTSTSLVTKTTTSDNELINYEFTATGTYYLRVYLFSGAPVDAVADYALDGFVGEFVMPTASFTVDPTEGSIPFTAHFDAAASDDSDGSIVLYEWDYDGDGVYDASSPTEYTASHVYLSPGSFTVKLRVTDNDGLTHTTTRIVRAIGQPPLADLQADITSGVAPLTVHLDASGSSDPEGDITLYRWDLDGDGAFDDQDTTEPLLTHDFIHGGTITAGVRVVDASDSTDDAFVDITCTNGPPIASVTANPLSGNTALHTNLDGSASTDPNGDIIIYRWDVDNDGSYEYTSQEPIFPHILFMDGSYTIVLQVEDGAGQTDTDSVSITVNPLYDETEPNDVYTQADDLPAFPFTGWNGLSGPREGAGSDYEDWSKFTISSAGTLTMYMQLFDKTGDIDIALIDSDGSTSLRSSVGTDDDEEIIWHFENPGTYYVRTYMFPTDETSKGGYEIQMSFVAD